MSPSPLARILIILGLALAAIGGLIYLVERLGLSFGNLPGNFRIERQNFSCVFALGSSILISILLTVVLNLVMRFLNR
ncbi:MAG: DUF2905 domain-containing protein [Chloroflexi bacterium]|nr:DUF2905 domain-containing protein [Chloroflexota bacterium]